MKSNELYFKNMICTFYAFSARIVAYYTTTYLAQNRMEINFVRNVSLTPLCSCTNMYNVEKSRILRKNFTRLKCKDIQSFFFIFQNLYFEFILSQSSVVIVYTLNVTK